MISLAQVRRIAVLQKKLKELRAIMQACDAVFAGSEKILNPQSGSFLEWFGARANQICREEYRKQELAIIREIEETRLQAVRKFWNSVRWGSAEGPEIVIDWDRRSVTLLRCSSRLSMRLMKWISYSKD